MKHETHKYFRPDARLEGKRVQIKRQETWYCAFPDCRHFTSRILVINKFSICNSCESKFLLTANLARVRKPKCQKCVDKRKLTRSFVNKFKATEDKVDEVQSTAADATLKDLLDKV